MPRRSSQITGAAIGERLCRPTDWLDAGWQRGGMVPLITPKRVTDERNAMLSERATLMQSRNSVQSEPKPGCGAPDRAVEPRAS